MRLYYFLTCFLVPNMLRAYFFVYWVTVFFEKILLDWIKVFMIISICSEQINKRQVIKRKSKKSCEQCRSQGPVLAVSSLSLLTGWVLTRHCCCQRSNFILFQQTLIEWPFNLGVPQWLILKFADKLILSREQCWESQWGGSSCPRCPAWALREQRKGFGGCWILDLP